MARDKNNDSDSAEGGAGSGVASPLWWAAAAVLVLILLGLVWVLTGGDASKSTAPPTRTVTASPAAPTTESKLPPASAPSATAPAGCNVPGANSTVPTSAIPATWQLLGGIAAPVSPVAGPKTITGPGDTLRSCYQRSPTGAVLAAMNIFVASTTPNSAQVLKQSFTPGPGLTEAQAQPVDGANASIVGFNTQACSQTACLVKIAFAVQGVNVEGTQPMVWVGGDWKVNGQVTGVAKGLIVNNLTGYIPMSALTAGPTS